MAWAPATLTIDIELTNRCNAACGFCPRDAMPQQGVMTDNVFEQMLARAVEFRALARRLSTAVEAALVFCGTGEPLVHRRAADHVRRVRDEGFACQLSTNGALLSRERAVALLDAGLGWINVNVSDLGGDYERVYGLPFARTRDNVERFIELAGGRCVVCIVVVDHRHDATHLRVVEEYWRSRGVDHVLRFGLVNRGGSLPIPATGAHTARPADRPAARDDASAPRLICPAPLMHLFVGYDGRYYLCSSDWRKEVAFGSVFDTSFAAITADKLAYLQSREPLCARCTLDPANLLLRRRRGVDPAGSRPFDAGIAELVDNDRRARVLAAEIMASA